VNSRELLEEALIQEEALGRNKNRKGQSEEEKRIAILKARAIRRYLQEKLQ